MPIKETQIVEADAERLYPLEIPLMIQNGSGTPHEEKLALKYRPLTPERMQGSLAQQLANIVAEWEVEDADGNMVKPTYEYFSRKPVTFLNKISDAIVGDYFPK